MVRSLHSFPGADPATGDAENRRYRKPRGHGATTPKDEWVEAEGIEFFVPGQDGNLPWNTIRPIEGRPVLLYLYDCRNREGEGYESAKVVERELFRNQHVIRKACVFVCEKLCLDSSVLDTEGGLIKAFSGSRKMHAKGAPEFLRELHKAMRANEKRMRKP